MWIQLLLDMLYCNVSQEKEENFNAYLTRKRRKLTCLSQHRIHGAPKSARTLLSWDFAVGGELEKCAQVRPGEYSWAQVAYRPRRGRVTECTSVQQAVRKTHTHSLKSKHNTFLNMILHNTRHSCNTDIYEVITLVTTIIYTSRTTSFYHGQSIPTAGLWSSVFLKHETVLTH